MDLPSPEYLRRKRAFVADLTQRLGKADIDLHSVEVGWSGEHGHSWRLVLKDLAGAIRIVRVRLKRGTDPLEVAEEVAGRVITGIAPTTEEST